MSRKRTDPSTAEAPQVTAVVTTETRERVIELASSRGVSTSAAARELIELGLEALDDAEGQQ